MHTGLEKQKNPNFTHTQVGFKLTVTTHDRDLWVMAIIETSVGNVSPVCSSSKKKRGTANAEDDWKRDGK